ncbi:glycolate oxidase subunit GlcF [Microbulbifer halophilus]|uniref:Glycolate oxidase iron-sulfur subunit n=1 Tax=Microbulbifer halophilus TaxID=453963 RepID=A0ABW5EE31_9GAMM|nr:glycolate oxidase subunit GlcF [Microbulbifer halophilus]MCW8126980.1 glycolate oxidase subunit GlcF [Microbulbifer halophilus]
MQVNLVENLISEDEAQRAEKILNACVHCGFCTATCPTYLQNGNELDSPRGRIYLIKEMLETGEAGPATRTHLDRCVTCQSCETTCPSGVEYHHLVSIGRETVERLAPRSFLQRSIRGLLRQLLLSPRLLKGMLGLGRLVSPLLPRSLRRVYFPTGGSRQQAAAGTGEESRAEAVLLVGGCVQPLLRPEIDSALARILDYCSVPVLRTRSAGCCGAASYHTSAEEQARELARENIDHWCAQLDERPVRAIVSSASGCAVHLKDYPALLADDPGYREKAERVAALLRDPVELAEEVLREAPLDAELLGGLRNTVFHCPCTLQHGQRLGGRVEALLSRLGMQLPEVEDAHLCCGSAGTYSMLQPAMARALREEKLRKLQATDPDTILTANIGCLLHLQGGTEKPVRHWLEVVADALDSAREGIR